MKRLLFIPMLALSLLFLSCDSETLTEPDESDSQALLAEVGPLSAPLPSPLEIYCVGASCSESGGDWYGGGVGYNLYYDVCDAEKGTVSIYGCQERGTATWVPKDRCLNHDGASWKPYGVTSKYNVADDCDHLLAVHLSGGPTRGYKVKYTAQGSGYKNSTLVFDSYLGSP